VKHAAEEAAPTFEKQGSQTEGLHLLSIKILCPASNELLY